MRSAATILLAVSVTALGDDQKRMNYNTNLRDGESRMLTNTDYSGQCVYCHSDGDMQMYGCDKGYNDQQFYIEQITPSDVDGRTNGYLIKSADNGLCLATTFNEKIFGWSDCSTSDQGGDGDRSWMLTSQGGGLRIESARYPGFCLATNNGWWLFRYPCGSSGQTWVFEPPFHPSPGHGTPFTDAEGLWYLAASNNGDITKSLTIGMSWTDSTTVTNSDQIGLSFALETSGKFLGSGAKATITASYAHTWSNSVMQSSTSTSSEGCSAACHAADLPNGTSGWNLMQWEMRGTAPKGTISTRTCSYLCLPQPMQPKCPVNCCQDRNYQTCRSCFKEGGDVIKGVNKSLVVV